MYMYKRKLQSCQFLLEIHRKSVKQTPFVKQFMMKTEKCTSVTESEVVMYVASVSIVKLKFLAGFLYSGLSCVPIALF